MLKRNIPLPTDIDKRLNEEFKMGKGEWRRRLYVSYNAQEKVLICSTKDDVKIPETYFLGQIGNLLFEKREIQLLDLSELFKDYKLIPSEKDGILCLILFNKGKDE